MQSFKKFLVEQRLNDYTKHIQEYEHHTKGPHGHFGGVGYLEEAMSPKQTEEAVRQKIKGRLGKMFAKVEDGGHGPADKKPPSTKELKHRVESRFDELGKMSHEQRQHAYAEAETRRKGIHGKTGGQPIASNSKTDTAKEIPTKNGKKGQIPLGMAFTPDTAKHYTSKDGKNHETRNSCAGSTGPCRSACLAKHGNYGFIGNQGHMALRTQRLTHNEHSTRDHATLVHQALHKASEKAKKEGKSVLLRGSVTDDSGADIHHDAVKKHFPHIEQMGYTKKTSTKHDPKNNIHTIFSDSGPMVKRDHKTGSVSMERENIQRRAVLKRATMGDKKTPGKGSYTVFNRKRPAATAKPGDKEYKEYHAHLEKLHTVRRYEPLHSEPEKGEKSEYHHPSGHGRVVHHGKSYRYQDHPVADKVQDIHGKEKFPAEHDSRNVDSSSRKLKDRHGNIAGHIVVAHATASTSNHDLHHSGFFHHVENVGHDGVYHDGHPAEMHRAGFSGVKKEHSRLTRQPVGLPSHLHTTKKVA